MHAPDPDPGHDPVPAAAFVQALAPSLSFGLLICATVLLASCGAPRAYAARPTAYDALASELEEDLAEARVFADSGRPAAALSRLGPLLSEHPRNLRLAVFQQELELAALAAGGEVRGIRPRPGLDNAAALYRVYRGRVEKLPSSAGWVLAARLASDPELCLADLDRALEIDRDNPWAHYGRAWALARLGRFREARAALERVFDIDGGHLPSVRLEASLLAGAGETVAAIGAFEYWLRSSLTDGSIGPQARSEVRLDLAILHVEEGQPAKALRLLEAVESRVPARAARVELVRAAAFQALGQDEEARRAVDFARRAAPDELLALAHEALLAAERGEPAAEAEAWRQALELAEQDEGAAEPSSADFRSLLIRLQAATRLARLGETDPVLAVPQGRFRDGGQP